MTDTSGQSLYQSLSAIKDDTKGLVAASGKHFGLDDKLMHSIGMVESSLDANAKASTSSAQGLYQFTKGTWNEQLSKYGAQYGLPENASRTDPVANAILAGQYIKSNAEAYKGTFGKDAGATEMYLGHFLGTTGRNNLMGALNKNPNTPISQVISAKQLNANKHLKGKTVQEVYDMYTNKLNTYMDGKVAPTVNQDLVKDQINKMMVERSNTVETEELQALQQGPTGDTPYKEFGLSGGDGSARPALGGDSIVDMVAAQKQAEEDDSMFKDTWSVVSAEARLSGVGRWWSDKQWEIGLFDYDSSIDFVREAFDPDVQVSGLNLTMEPIEFTKELHEAVTKAGLNEEWFTYLETATTKDQFMYKLQQALEMQKADSVRKNAPVGSGLVGAVASAPLDPLTYLGGGVAKAGTSLLGRTFIAGAEAAVGGIASEGLLELDTKGAIEGQYAEAAAGAFVFGSTMHIVGDKMSDIIGTRLKARQESLDAGLDDISKSDVRLDSVNEYVDHPTEPGSVILGDGTIISATNPMNPKLQEEAVKIDRADKNIALLKGIRELALTVLDSDDDAVRKVGIDLMRSPVGMKSGGSGKASMTGEDILAMNEGRDFMRYNELHKAINEATETGYFGFNRGSDSWLASQRQIVESLESGKLDGLTDAQRKVVGIINENMLDKFEAARNPGIYGRADAKPVYETGRDPSGYFPQVYDIGLRNRMITRFGDMDTLKVNIKENWEAQVKADHNGIRGKFKEYFKEDLEANAKLENPMDVDEKLDELIDDYIERKAYGIANQGEFTHSAGLEDVDIKDSLIGIENNNFAAERNMFDSTYQTPGTDSMGFALNDMRHFDIMNVMQMYNKRMNGDIAIHGSTGKTTKELKDEIVNLSDAAGKRALDQAVRIMTGRSRVQTPGGVMNMLGKAANDFAFGSKGGMMWSTQLTELAGFTTNRMMKVMTGGIPALRQMVNPQARFTKKDMELFRSTMFGSEINRVMQGSFKAYKEHLVENGYGNATSNLTAGVRRSMQIYAQKSPFTRLLNKTTEVMVNMARSGVLGDIADEALTGGVKFRPEILRAASITDEQYAGIKALFKENIKIDSNGNYKPNLKAIKNDIRANDLWRLADYVASDTVFRTNKLGMSYTEQPSAGVAIALQFKAFVLKGLNGKFIRMFNEAGKGRAVDHTLQSMMSIGFGAAIYTMQAHYKAFGLPEDKRQAYLDKALGDGMLSYQAINRSSVFGAPMGVLGLVGTATTGADIFKVGRTTVNPASIKATKDIKSDALGRYDRTKEMAGRAADIIPALSPISSLAGLPAEGYGMVTGEYGYEQASHGKAFFELLGNIVPNDPATQMLINSMAEQFGVLDNYK